MKILAFLLIPPVFGLLIYLCVLTTVKIMEWIEDGSQKLSKTQRKFIGFLAYVYVCFGFALVLSFFIVKALLPYLFGE